MAASLMRLFGEEAVMVPKTALEFRATGAPVARFASATSSLNQICSVVT